MRYQRPKGTADILPGTSEKWQFVEETARKLFAAYRYQEIRTPMFESFDVFSRTSGETSDIVTKEMYDFHDKGDRHITLRPEGTAGVVRAFVENKLYGPDTPKPVKMYYMGPMFRYERPQSGRQRQFHQIGVEAFGSESPELDVEVISMAVNYLQNLGIDDLRVAINTLGDKQTRADYRQALIDYLEPHFEELSDDSKERLHKNPLRVLDSKAPEDQLIVDGAPSILDYLTDDAQKHFDKVTRLLDDLGIKYDVDHTMVRGLDYYNHTIFEIMANAKELGEGYTTICAGGRYDGLVEELGGPQMPGVGFGLGVERLLLLMDSKNFQFPDTFGLDAYVVGIGDDASVEALKIVQALRNQDFKADKDYLARKPKAQFKSADKLDAKFTLTLGDNELESNTIHVKNMADGNEVTVDINEVKDNFAELISKNFK
ncbi:histidine--tRNA ligase [Apilactobacillus kunkeei DSM 12361 = ATCC 700308]|uniref:Histidine--tRNA ligase n=1 Tax=Apilactobacillus kunkeei DSM 12361 = ATCC 700308 TaxID=1423768 RepID=A0A0R1FSE2_9LACO|nr:histidine--tRNA ligase [Apilactobacillus kunkeei]KOY73092.1 Histidine--tRNA ligase [Apilactobacillus kunkeei DSM 12361 = ATCC 700308]KRK24651.1 histidine--tRNA ligase [Apilactobacillus kunkeei DSM 12361 = ATCC 700308]MCK8634926.1 histidine--tRNA ligase [Apilactobacillus kunkeei]QYU52538.1 histidine--tRNA ligase [Apilactobacillus kunkeei]